MGIHTPHNKLLIFDGAVNLFLREAYIMSDIRKVKTIMKSQATM